MGLHDFEQHLWALVVELARWKAWAAGPLPLSPTSKVYKDIHNTYSMKEFELIHAFDTKAGFPPGYRTELLTTAARFGTFFTEYLTRPLHTVKPLEGWGLPTVKAGPKVGYTINPYENLLTKPFIGVDYANKLDDTVAMGFVVEGDKLKGQNLDNVVLDDLFWSSEPPKEVKPVALKSHWGKCDVCKGPIGACKHTSSAVAMMAKNAKAKTKLLKKVKKTMPALSPKASEDFSKAIGDFVKEFQEKSKKEAAYKVQLLSTFSTLEVSPAFFNLDFNGKQHVPAPNPVNLAGADPATAPFANTENMQHIHKIQQETAEQYARSISIFITSFEFEKFPRYTPYKLRETVQGMQVLTPLVIDINEVRKALNAARTKIIAGVSPNEACEYFNSYLPVPAGFTPLRVSDLHTEHSLRWYLNSLLAQCSAKIAGEEAVNTPAADLKFISETLVSIIGKQDAKDAPVEHEVVELTLTGLTKEEAEHVLKTVTKSKSGQPVVVSKKVRKDEGTNSKGVIFWEFESSSSSVNGTPLKWIAQLNEDGTLSCQCRGWTVGSAKSARGRHCKHTDSLEQEFNIKALFKKWKNGEPLGEEFAKADSPEASLVVQEAKKASGGTMKFKRVIEL